MKTVLMLRHAKSSWDDPSLGDHDRPLNPRGERDAPRMGALLVEEDRLPDLVLTSTAARARATAERVTEAAGYDGELRVIEDLYHAGVDDFVRVLETVEDEFERVMVVAHNPGLEDFVERLGRRHERLPTAALVELELEIDRWIDLRPSTSGRLVHVWRPKEL